MYFVLLHANKARPGLGRREPGVRVAERVVRSKTCERDSVCRKTVEFRTYNKQKAPVTRTGAFWVLPDKAATGRQ